jgi:hypothetical protein
MTIFLFCFFLVLFSLFLFEYPAPEVHLLVPEHTFKSFSLSVKKLKDWRVNEGSGQSAGFFSAEKNDKTISNPLRLFVKVLGLYTFFVFGKTIGHILCQKLSVIGTSW